MPTSVEQAALHALRSATQSQDCPVPQRHTFSTLAACPTQNCARNVACALQGHWRLLCWREVCSGPSKNVAQLHALPSCCGNRCWEPTPCASAKHKENASKNLLQNPLRLSCR